MRGNRAHDVVDLPVLQHLQAERAHEAADGADDDRPMVFDDVRPGGDGDEAADGAVQHREQVHAPENGLRGEKDGDATRRRREICADEHVAHRHRIDRALDHEHRAAVEPEPAEPQDEDAQGDQRDVGGRRGLDAAVFAELPAPRAYDDYARKRRPSPGRVHDGGTGEIAEAQLGEPASAPRPGAHQRVDDAGQDGDEDEERPQLHALGESARDDGGGGRHERHLEEPERHTGVVGPEHGLRGLLVPRQDREFIRRGPEQELDRAYPAANVHEHEVVADDVEHDPGDPVEADVLETNHRGVLGAHRTRFEHREARAHPHDEHTADQQKESVEYELVVCDPGLDGRGRFRSARRENKNNEGDKHPAHGGRWKGNSMAVFHEFTPILLESA